MRLIDLDDDRHVYCGEEGDYERWNIDPEIQAVDAVPVVRCKDCRWWDKSEDSPFGYCMAMKHGYMSANWEIGIYRKYKGDFYCADGERDKE